MRYTALGEATGPATECRVHGIAYRSRRWMWWLAVPRRRCPRRTLQWLPKRA